MYDAFAARYGYKIDEFYNLTRRQIWLITEAMNEGKYIDLKERAALQGVKLKPLKQKVNFSTDQSKKLDELANINYMKSKAEYLRKNG